MGLGLFYTLALVGIVGVVYLYNKIPKQKSKKKIKKENINSASEESPIKSNESYLNQDTSSTDNVSFKEEKLIFCRNCNNKLKPSTKGCLKCGFPPFLESNFCHECGCETKERQVICISCNADLEIRSFESFESILINKNVETSATDNSSSENNSSKNDNQKPQIENIKQAKVQFKEWWSQRTKKEKIWIVVGCLFFLGLINNLGGGDKSKSSNDSASENGKCSQYGDERYIENKMKQLNRDVIDITETGDRKYYVRYIDWSRGSGREGDMVLDYSSSPCHD